MYLPLTVMPSQETSRIPVTGVIDFVTAKLLLEQVLAHFKKPKKKKVAFADESTSGSEKAKEADGEKGERSGKGVEDDQVKTADEMDPDNIERRPRTSSERVDGDDEDETFFIDGSQGNFNTQLPFVQLLT